MVRYRHCREDRYCRTDYVGKIEPHRLCKEGMFTKARGKVEPHKLCRKGKTSQTDYEDRAIQIM